MRIEKILNNNVVITELLNEKALGFNRGMTVK